QEPSPAVPLLPSQANRPLHEPSPIVPLAFRHASKPLHELSPTVPVRPLQASSPLHEPSPICGCSASTLIGCAAQTSPMAQNAKTRRPIRMVSVCIVGRETSVYDNRPSGSLVLRVVSRSALCLEPSHCMP